MRAVTWQGPKNIQVSEVPDPAIQEPTDAIIKVTSTGLCGSDLHLYDPLSPFMEPGDIVGHEAMGIVEAVGDEVGNLVPGDRVVVPFNISCGRCWMCARGLQSQCETTQNREHGTGASLFGYSKLYGQVAGGQAEYVRVPFADYGPVKVRHEHPDDRYLFLSDVLPTAWQAVEYAGLSSGAESPQTLLVLGAGPIGDMSARIALHRGHRVIVADRIPERLARVATRGAETIDIDGVADVAEQVRSRTDGRGADAVIDAVGMEAHGAPLTAALQKAAAMLPSAISQPILKKAGIDRLTALLTAIDAVRRGGTVSLSGVYGGAMDPLPMMQMFDKQVQLRMGQANVRRWTDDILALVDGGDDVLGVESFATHHLPLDEAPRAYADFRDKADGMVKVVFRP